MSLDQEHGPNMCCICLGPLNIPGQSNQTLPCEHKLHESCITEMRRFGISRSCPLCRTESSDLTPVQQLLEQAVLAARRGLHQRNFELISELLTIDPENGLGHFLLGQSYQFGRWVSQDYSQAAYHYEAARHAAQFGDSAVLHAPLGLTQQDLVANNLGEVYKKLGKWKEAENLFWEAHHLGDSSGTFNLAYMQQEQGNETLAIDLYFEACRRGGTGGAVAAHNLGRKYMRAGKLKDAARLFEQAHAGGYEASFMNLVHVLLQDGQTLKVTDAIVRALLTGPHHQAISTLHYMRDEALDGGILMWSAVRIHSLKSARGLALNGLAAHVWGYDCASERFCVVLTDGRRGEEKVLLQRSNLEVVSVWLDRDLSQLFDEVRDIALQKCWNKLAISASISAEEQAQHSQDKATSSTSQKNASLMEAILHSQPSKEAACVVILKYSRDPECFHAVLQTDPQLQECQLQLKNHGLPFRLPSGAYLFVQPDELSAVLDYISEHKVQLGPSHVLVSEAVEDAVTQCVASLPRKHKILVQNRDQ